jgi:glucose-1-phosphate adenylyltransferase
MRLLALVLAGGEGTRLYPLTAKVAKPALHLAHGYRIIDFVLSNLVNSKVAQIYVLAQYCSESLVRHIESVWRPWAAGPGSLIKVALPRSDLSCDRYQGTADAVRRNLDLLERHDPDLIAVFAADHVYRMDVRQMADFHFARRAEVTVAAVPVPLKKAVSFGVLATAENGSVLEFQEKPERPRPMPSNPALAYASMGNYMFEPRLLRAELEQARHRGGWDFGHDIMPGLPGRARIFAYDFLKNEVPGVQASEERGYWRDVGTIDALSAARSEVFGPRPRFNMLNQRWPIRGANHAPTATQQAQN